MGIKLICISASNRKGITKDKEYKIEKSDASGNFYEIENDNGYLSLYPRKLFVTLAEYREKQINDILRD